MHDLLCVARFVRMPCVCQTELHAACVTHWVGGYLSQTLCSNSLAVASAHLCVSAVRQYVHSEWLMAIGVATWYAGYYV